MRVLCLHGAGTSSSVSTPPSKSARNGRFTNEPQIFALQLGMKPTHVYSTRASRTHNITQLRCDTSSAKMKSSLTLSTASGTHLPPTVCITT